MQKKIVFYIVIIIIILIAVFLSQQAYSRGIIKSFFSYINKYANASLLGGFNFNLGSNKSSNNSSSNAATNTVNGSGVDNNDKNLVDTASNSSNTQKLTTISPNIGGYITMGLETVSGVSEKVGESIKSGGEAIQNEAIQAQQNISDAEKNLQNYFSGISDAIQGKENNSSSCQCPASQ